MTPEEARQMTLNILAAPDDEVENWMRRARGIRRQVWGDRVFLRAVIEFANDCANDCLYCGMRRSNRGLARFTLDKEEIMGAAARARELGIRTVFLQSAEDKGVPNEWLVGVVRSLRRELGVGVILCVGARTAEEFRALREAGASKFIIKHETADRALFEKLKPDLTLPGRLAYIRAAQEAGFDVGSGTIVGLPGQTAASLADDVALLVELGVNMASCSIFMPHVGTPLAAAPPGDARVGARLVTAMRIALPAALIPATSTFEKALPGEGQALALGAGANVVTINLTPEGRKGDYQLYTDRFFVRWEHATEIIARAGLEVAEEGA